MNEKIDKIVLLFRELKKEIDNYPSAFKFYYTLKTGYGIDINLDLVENPEQIEDPSLLPRVQLNAD